MNSGTNPRDLAERTNSGINPGDLVVRENSGTNLGNLTEKVKSGTNPRGLVERVNSGTNPRDLAKRANSSTNPGDLAERTNSGTNPGDLAERTNSGTNHGDFAERVNLDTNPGDLTERMHLSSNPRDLTERMHSGSNPGDLAERMHSGSNPGDLAERMHLGSNPGDLVERTHTWVLRYSDAFNALGGFLSDDALVVSSLRSGEASQCDPEVGSSGASSGPPSPVDARVLIDLEVMKADHDLDTAVIEGSLAVIRERYSIPIEYGLHVPQPGQCPYSSDAPGMCISVDALEAGLRFPLHPLIEECLSGPVWRFRLDWSAHPIGNASPYLSEEESVLVGRLKGILSSSCAIKEMTELWLVEAGLGPAFRGADEEAQVPSRRGGVSLRSKGKEPAAPSEELDTPAEFEGGASPVHRRQRSMKDLFKMKVYKDDAGYYTLQMSDLGHQDPNKEMKARWRGLKNSTKTSKKELHEVWSNLAEVQQLLKEARVRARKMDDELLQAVKSLESA
ncbi:hypothetical protein B296_00008722 [Ensete ventricosum]|uniref:Uncharacterized protein n=1 Tax=Ensete ventricosum TaxID=4639 RepID=A0A426ZR73_ENSVE|nr:hypothetical protein B296_00008722 [Ensete ventricosum]